MIPALPELTQRTSTPVVVETAPLSPGQQRLIADEFALPGGQWPKVGAATRLRPMDTAAVLIDGPLDTDALRSAIRGLVARQPALRTTFRQLANGTAVQLVTRAAEIPFRFSDKRGTSAATHPAESLLAQLPAVAVDPRKDPLFRTHLIRLGENQHVLLLQVHHLISDGWSIGVLYRDLSSLYHAAVNRRPPQLPELPISFASFCREMHYERGGDNHQDQLQYWRTRLHPPLLDLPRPATAPPVTADPDVNPVSVLGVTIDAPTVKGLRHAARLGEHRGGVAGPLLAALALVLHHHTGGNDVRFGMMISNRGRPNSENLIGYFVNTAVIRLTITGALGIAMLTDQATAAVTDAIEHQELPIQDLRRALQDDGALDRTPLYQVTVALNTMRTRSLELQSATCHDVDMHDKRSRLAPTRVEQRWVLEASSGALIGTLTYRTEIPGAVETLADLGPALDAVAAGEGTVGDVCSRLRLPTRRPQPSSRVVHP